MNVVFLSGGSGKRLWPLSNDLLSKQFLKLLKNDSGEYESMVQRVTRQLKENHKDANIFVSCNFAQNDIMRKQLGQVDVISEPARRNTFPAIVLAAAHLFYNKGMNHDDVFIVCPIDPFAEALYFKLLEEVAKPIAAGQFNIGLMGALPTYPSAKYGYILQSEGTVSGFKEKPSEADAEGLIQQGALWNCGIFALKLGYVLEHARKYVSFDTYETLHAQYDKLPSISFDYEVVEKESAISVVVYEGIWKDLGTWNTLSEEVDQPIIGDKVLMGDGCSNTHVFNMLDLPIIVHDVADAVVVASHDGILVSSKTGSSHIKPLADQIVQQPMYEQHQWGTLRIVDNIKRARIDAGHSMIAENLSDKNEVWVVVSGCGNWNLDGDEREVAAGSVMNVPKGAKSMLLATLTIELISVSYAPSGFSTVHTG